MRHAFATLLLTSLTALGQQSTPMAPKEPEPRFGVQVKLKVYPQETAKKTLESALEACDKGDYKYLVAHLLDPAFVEMRITERAKQFEAKVEVELSTFRDLQYANPDLYPPENRLPKDRAGFQAAVVSRSRDLAFRQLLRDVEQKLLDDPQALKDMRKILRSGTFADEGAGVKAANPAVKDGAIYFKKIGDRWFIENRQTEETKKEQ